MLALVIEVRACQQAGKARRIFCVVALLTVWAWATAQKWGTPK